MVFYGFQYTSLALTTLPPSLLPAFSVPQGQLEVKPYAGLGHVYNTAHACGLLEFREYATAFPSPYEYLIPQFFLLSVLISFLLSPAGTATPGR